MARDRFGTWVRGAYFGTTAIVLLALGSRPSPVIESAPAGARAVAPSELAVARPPLREATHIDGRRLSVDAVFSECRIDVECTVALYVRARDDFHVSEEYPHKFVADVALDVDLLGDGRDARSFNRSSGTRPNPIEPLMLVRFVPRTGGAARIEGTLRTAVCNETDCEIEKPRVAVEVPVT